MQLFLPIASTMIEASSIESAAVVASSEESAAVVASSVKASAIDVPSRRRWIILRRLRQRKGDAFSSVSA